MTDGSHRQSHLHVEMKYCGVYSSAGVYTTDTDVHEPDQGFLRIKHVDFKLWISNNLDKSAPD